MRTGWRQRVTPMDATASSTAPTTRMSRRCTLSACRGPDPAPELEPSPCRYYASIDQASTGVYTVWTKGTDFYLDPCDGSRGFPPDPYQTYGGMLQSEYNAQGWPCAMSETKQCVRPLSYLPTTTRSPAPFATSAPSTLTLTTLAAQLQVRPLGRGVQPWLCRGANPVHQH